MINPSIVLHSLQNLQNLPSCLEELLHHDYQHNHPQLHQPIIFPFHQNLIAQTKIYVPTSSLLTLLLQLPPFCLLQLHIPQTKKPNSHILNFSPDTNPTGAEILHFYLNLQLLLHFFIVPSKSLALSKRPPLTSPFLPNAQVLPPMTIALLHKSNVLFITHVSLHHTVTLILLKLLLSQPLPPLSKQVKSGKPTQSVLLQHQPRRDFFLDLASAARLPLKENTIPAHSSAYHPSTPNLNRTYPSQNPLHSTPAK